MAYPILRQVCVLDEKVRANCGKELINSVRFYRCSGGVVEEMRRGVN
jgi:hypothetical protein